MEVVYAVMFFGGFYLTNDYGRLLGAIDQRSFVKVRSFVSWWEAYYYACRAYAKMCYGSYAPHGHNHPIPPLEWFLQDRGHFIGFCLPPFRIATPRVFAVIAEGLAMALVCDISELAGYLKPGMQFRMMEFPDENSGQEWLDKQVFIELTAMGAYIPNAVYSVSIPSVGEQTQRILHHILPVAGPDGQPILMPAPANAPALQEPDKGYERMEFNTLPAFD